MTQSLSYSDNLFTYEFDSLVKAGKMSELEAAAQCYSDMYKAVHGIRPRWMFNENTTVEGLREAIANLQIEAAHIAEAERQRTLEQRSERRRAKALRREKARARVAFTQREFGEKPVSALRAAFNKIFGS